jgi:biopolymer transport protein ExbB
MKSSFVSAGLESSPPVKVFVAAVCAVVLAFTVASNVSAQDAGGPAAQQPSAQSVPAPSVPEAPPSAPAPETSQPADASSVPLQPGAQQGDPAAPPTVLSAPGGGSPSEDSAEGETHPAETAHLPHDLSPWKMFLAADYVVKSVMIGLALASVVTWTVWLSKSLELAMLKRRLRRAFAQISGSASLREATERLRDGTSRRNARSLVSSFLDVAAIELRLSADVSDKSGIKERVQSRLDGLAAAAGREVNRGTGILASIGSTAPFIGLFGTVWGIMNSFVGIAETQTTNLAVVAPGIAEALLATATGLVAAIPAVITYNQFARQIAGYKAMIGEVSAEVMRLVSRDLDRGLMPAATEQKGSATWRVV